MTRSVTRTTGGPLGGARPRRAILQGAGALAALAGCDAALPGGGPSAGGPLPLLFSSQGNLAMMSLDGTSRRALTKVPSGALVRDPAWSPDGRHIVYAYTPPLPSVRGPGGLLPLPAVELHLMNADGSGSRVLVPSGGPGVTFDSPVWAPDGSALYVTYSEVTMRSNVVTDATVEVARLPLSGGPDGPRSSGPRQTLVRDASAPTISPDGTRLVCVSMRAGGTDGQALLLAASDGSNVRQPLPAHPDGFNAPRFSPDGRRIAFARTTPPLPVPTTTPVPGRPLQTPPTAAPTTVRRADAARLPALLALLAPGRARAHGTPMDVFSCGAEGEDLRRLTELGEDDPSPAWSPDGRRIAFLAEGGVYVMNADGSDLTHLTHDGGHSRIDWRR